MIGSPIFYFFLICGNFAYSLRRDTTPKNLIIETLDRKLKINGHIKTIGDIKRCLKEQHGYTHNDLYSCDQRLNDDEIYCQDKHKNLRLTSTIRGGMNIKVETMQGKKLQLQVSQNETVLDLKKKLEEKQTIPVDQQRLIFNGKLLENGKTISEYGIREDSVLHLVLRLRGG